MPAGQIGLRFARILELAAGVRIATGVKQPFGLANGAVGFVPVSLQDTGEALQQSHGTADGRWVRS
jgi:hypothetical protein